MPNVYYKVYAGGRWYSEVKNLDDYAGDAIHAIKGIAVKTDIGSVKYRVHTRNGHWYPYVTGYHVQDSRNGFAGDLVNDIDMVEIYYTTPAGYVTRKAKYRVAPVGKTIIPGSLTMKPGTAWMAMPVPPECSWVNFRIIDIKSIVLLDKESEK